MKQITMDFETYEAELKEQRLKGFEISRNLLPRLQEMMKALNGYSSDDFNKARNELLKLIYEVQTLEAGE